MNLYAAVLPRTPMPKTVALRSKELKVLTKLHNGLVIAQHEDKFYLATILRSPFHIEDIRLENESFSTVCRFADILGKYLK